METARGVTLISDGQLVDGTGRTLVATRFSFDYGWYPHEDEMLETDLPFVSLWYAIGGDYGMCDGEWRMSDRPWRVACSYTLRAVRLPG